MLMEDRICKLVLRGIFSFSFVVFLIVVFPIFLLELEYFYCQILEIILVMLKVILKVSEPHNYCHAYVGIS